MKQTSDTSNPDEQGSGELTALREGFEQFAEMIGPLPDAQRAEVLEQLLGRKVCRRLGVYSLPEGFRLSVVIPAYNEAGTIEAVAERVRTTGIPTELIIVDDGSTDGTREIVARWREQHEVKVVYHEKNRGKGAAMRSGFAVATGDVVLVQDADLEYDPDDYSRLIQPIVEGRADVVYGSRFSGSDHRVLYFWHYVGNRLLTMLSNLTTNLNLSDMESGYKVFRREVLMTVLPRLREDRFGFEPEITAKIARIPGIRIFERAISYSGRTYQEGKKITWRDGFRALWCIVRYARG